MWTIQILLPQNTGYFEDQNKLGKVLGDIKLHEFMY